MTAFEYGDDMILVDAGLMFPDDEQLGIDLVLPDYTYVTENEDKLRGIIITHGHEDHTGALPYLLRDLRHKVPVYSSSLTLGFIEGKLAEHRIRTPKLKQVSDGMVVSMGAFEVRFFSMTHSIPAALGVFIKTPAGTVMHTGDFKLDQTPIDGVTPNYRAISQCAAEGIDLLMSDSTNATVPGFTPSEAEVGPALRHIIKNASGRVFVASFASHIHRIQQVCDASVAVGRKVVVTGRSMVTNTKVARRLGHLRISDDDIMDAYDAEDVPDDRIVVLCTGSQGEPLSALARMVNGDHRSLSITADDTVIISATPVPGNEKSVAGIVNALSKIGCSVYDKSKALVHVSGHGSQEELKLMLVMASPTYFMPVHGEAMHLRAHADLAKRVGIPSDRIFVVENGDTLVMRNHKVHMGDPVESGVVYVDGLSVTDADPVVLRDRQQLSKDGVVTCMVTMSRRPRRMRGVEICSRGVSFSNDGDLSAEIRETIRKCVDECSAEDMGTAQIRRDIRRGISNLVWARTHTHPIILPVVMLV